MRRDWLVRLKQLRACNITISCINYMQLENWSLSVKKKRVGTTSIAYTKNLHLCIIKASFFLCSSVEYSCLITVEDQVCGSDEA